MSDIAHSMQALKMTTQRKKTTEHHNKERRTQHARLRGTKRGARHELIRRHWSWVVKRYAFLLKK